MKCLNQSLLNWIEYDMRVIKDGVTLTPLNVDSCNASYKNLHLKQEQLFIGVTIDEISTGVVN